MYNAEMLLGQDYFSTKGKKLDMTKSNSFREFWRVLTLLKAIAKDSSFDEIIEKNIVRDKRIKSGVAIIKGTRISTSDVMRMLSDDYNIEEVLDNFPTLKDKNQVLAAITYEVRKWNFIFKIFKYSKSNKQ